MKIAQSERQRNPRLHRAAILTTLTWSTNGKGKERGVLEDWTRMFAPNWTEIALDAHLGRTALRVLLFSATHLGADNVIQCTQKQLAEALRVSQPAVSQVMRGLVEQGLILRSGQTYWLNSRLVAKQALSEVVHIRHEEAQYLRALEAALLEETGRT